MSLLSFVFFLWLLRPHWSPFEARPPLWILVCFSGIFLIKKFFWYISNTTSFSLEVFFRNVVGVRNGVTVKYRSLIQRSTMQGEFMSANWILPVELVRRSCSFSFLKEEYYTKYANSQCYVTEFYEKDSLKNPVLALTVRLRWQETLLSNCYFNFLLERVKSIYRKAFSLTEFIRLNTPNVTRIRALERNSSSLTAQVTLFMLKLKEIWQESVLCNGIPPIELFR